MEGVLTASPYPRLTSRLIPCGREAAPLLLCIHGGGCNAGYFDLKGFSVAQVALAAGFDVLLINRPGYGGSAPPATGSPIVEAAKLIQNHLTAILPTRASSEIVVIGHSIGGAVALTLAAERQLTLRGVAVSGIGRTLSDAAAAWLSKPASAAPEPPAAFFFGPEGSYDWRGPLALRKAMEPWRMDELLEVRTEWPIRFDVVAGAITVPVAFHLAEHEGIWRADTDDVADAAFRFHAAARVEAGVLANGGHLYEIHKRGPELAAQQIRFLKQACAASKP